MDIEDIRRRLQAGHLDYGYWYQQVTALCDDLEETRAALAYWKDGQAMRDLSEACRQLRKVDAENKRLKERAHALEGSTECVIDAHTLGEPIAEHIAHLAALLFDEEESTNDTRS